MATSSPRDRSIPDTGTPDAAPSFPDHPSYMYAKAGMVVEPVPQAHLDRNQWMEYLAPDVLPTALPFADPRTGLTWSEDKQVGELVYHGNNECIRAPIDMARVEVLRADPEYREAFQALSGSADLQVNQALPSAQACYDPSSGQIVASGPHVGTWDFANPDVPGQGYAHWVMDMAPDHRADNYTPVPLVAPPLAPDLPAMPAVRVQDLMDASSGSGASGGGGGGGTSSSDSGSSGGGSSE